MSSILTHWYCPDCQVSGRVANQVRHAVSVGSSRVSDPKSIAERVEMIDFIIGFVADPALMLFP